MDYQSGNHHGDSLGDSIDDEKSNHKIHLL